MPSGKDLFYAGWEVLRELGTRAIVLAKRHTGALLGSALVVLALMTAWSWYQQWRVTRFVILAGPGGSASLAEAKRISRKIDGSSTTFGAAYRTRYKQTDGFEEVRQLVSEDQTGTLIGFAHDGFGNADNVRILLPLDMNHLFIFARKGFVADRLPEGAKPTLGEILKNQKGIEAGRLYLGPTDSGTRQLGSLVLNHYKIDPMKCHAIGIDDWHDMRSALAIGSIDMAFYSGPLNASIAAAIASDENCVLVGLDGDCDALIQGRSHLHKVRFAAQSFASGNFCPQSLETIASRRVLICSPQMSDSTAYFLAERAKEALEPQLGKLVWTNPLPTGHQPEGFAYQPHPGALRQHEGKPISSIPWDTNYVLMTLALFTGTEILVAVNTRLKKNAAEHKSIGEGPSGGSVIVADVVSPAAPGALVATPSEPKIPFHALEVFVDGLVADFTAQPAVLNEKQHTEWQQKIAKLRTKVEEMYKAGQLGDRDYEAVLSIIAKIERTVPDEVPSAERGQQISSTSE